MAAPRFLSVAELMSLHDDLLAHFGGASGLRDEGELISAAMAPQNHWFYSEHVGDVFTLAAVLLTHLGRNHPFVDGDKRVAAAAALVMLTLNGIEIDPDADVLEKATLQAVQGKLELEALAAVFRKPA
jgi:death-on-curing protein